MKQLVSVTNPVRRTLDNLDLLQEGLENHEPFTDMCRDYLVTYGVLREDLGLM